MYGVTEATIAPSTVAWYNKRTRLLIERYHRETGRHPWDDNKAFIAWFEALKATLSASTIRGYKAALLNFFKQADPRGLYKLLKKIDTRGCKPKASKLPHDQRRTSQKKRRGVSQKDVDKIIDTIMDKKDIGYWLLIGAHVFAASYLTGLRPIEWASAEIITPGGQPWLRVKNAKHSNGRAHGRFRHISLHQFSTSSLKVIETTIKYAAASLNSHGKRISASRFRELYSAAFSRHSHKIFDKRKRTIPIYCARHQFAANLKKAGYTRSQIAALMGHASDATASRHYCGKRWGHSRGDLPVPLAEEVSRIRQVAKPNPHTAQKTKAATQRHITRATSISPKTPAPTHH